MSTPPFLSWIASSGVRRAFNAASAAWYFYASVPRRIYLLLLGDPDEAENGEDGQLAQLPYDRPIQSLSSSGASSISSLPVACRQATGTYGRLPLPSSTLKSRPAPSVPGSPAERDMRMVRYQPPLNGSTGSNAVLKRKSAIDDGDKPPHQYQKKRKTEHEVVAGNEEVVMGEAAENAAGGLEDLHGMVGGAKRKRVEDGGDDGDDEDDHDQVSRLKRKRSKQEGENVARVAEDEAQNGLGSETRDRDSTTLYRCTGVTGQGLLYSRWSKGASSHPPVYYCCKRHEEQWISRLELPAADEM